MAAPPDPIYSFKGNQSQVHCINFYQNSKAERLLSGTRTGHVYIWDLPTQSLSDSFLTGDGTCISVLVPDGQDCFITHNRGDCVKKWMDSSRGGFECAAEFKTSSLQFCGAQSMWSSSSRDQLVVFPAGEDRCIQVATFKQEQKVVSQLEYPTTVGNIMSLCDAGSGRLLALFEAGELLLWDLRNTKHSLSYKIEMPGNEMNPSAAMCLAFSTQKQLGLIGSTGNTLHPLALNANFSSLPCFKITNPGINQISFRSDHKILATACWDSKVRIFSVRNRDSNNVFRPLAVLPTLVEDKSVSCVTFSDRPVSSFGGKTILAAAGEACSILLWDIFN